MQRLLRAGGRIRHFFSLSSIDTRRLRILQDRGLTNYDPHGLAWSLTPQGLHQAREHRAKTTSR